ncbi:MAG: hypothetical protein AB1726_00595 [Planctomycetota bacterium]
MEKKVQGPAIGLIVTAALGVLGALLNIVSAPFQSAQDFGAQIPDWAQFLVSGAVGIAIGVIGIALSGLVLWGALRMMKLQNHTLAVVVSVLAMIPVLSPCCCVGIPVGIWALVVLLNDEVKQAFQS